MAKYGLDCYIMGPENGAVNLSILNSSVFKDTDHVQWD